MHPLDRVFKVEQFLPRSLEEVFDFFSRAENLEKITPPWLHFKILSVSTPQIEKGTLIDYQLRIHGIPVRWRTEIQKWNPPLCFQDSQIRGPYRKWEHTHYFREVSGGSEMIDEVVYRLPMGALGSFIAGAWVRHDVEGIFKFRSQKVLEFLS